MALVPEKVIGPTVPLAQTTTLFSVLIVGVGITVMITVSVSGLQGPDGSFVINVKVMVPVKPAGGVYVLVKLLASEKAPPLLEVQLPVEAAPPTIPFNCKDPFLQTGL